ncbi:MAG TPA: c-type cytochrome biogenesis protein CcmI [Pseudomonadales bacterium]|nr:c-type cytochrome biogenesis protein CcmI [Pseudomonadales bacterium]
MTLFWILALLMGALAAAFVLWPLLRHGDGRAAGELRARSNLAIFEDRLAELEADRREGRIGADEFEALRSELERSLLRDVDAEDLDADPEAAAAPGAGAGRGLVFAGAVLVPLLAVVLYADWGASFGALAELELAEDVRQLDAADGPEGEQHDGDMNALAARLEARLAADAEDPDGWFLLGRTRLNLGDFEGAAVAFGKVAELTGGGLVPRVFQTQALYLADDRRLTARVRAVMDQVLAIDPEQAIMLELLAMDAFQDQRFAQAADLFERVLRTEIPDPARREFLEDGRVRARELAGLPPAPLAGAAPGPAVAASVAGDAAGIGIRVRLSVAPALLENLPDSARIFVLARAAGGPRMPLAVERHAPTERLDVRLDAGDAMSPAMSISSAPRVEVLARLSMSGTAMAGEGDVEIVAGPVPTDRSSEIELRLGADGSPEPVIRLLDAPVAAAAPAAPEASSTPAAGATALRVLVEVEAGLQVPPDATLFVFAREVGGPPMPIAVQRLRAADLPALVSLDDSMAMVPGRTLSSVARVQVVARVSASGGVSAAAGDLEGVSEVIEGPTARVVPLLIDRTID